MVAIPIVAPRKEHPWHPALAFLAGESRLLNPEVWLAIDNWLKRRGADDDMMSMRERSYEIFGDEKRLDAVKRHKWFAEGRISLSRLRCQPVPEPLVAQVCKGEAAIRAVLVIENKDTFKSACLANLRYSLFVMIIFGEGCAFPGRVNGLAELTEEVPFDTIRYFGDIDAEGFDIARRTEAAIRNMSNFQFEMAVEFYRPLLAMGQPAGAFGRMSPEVTAFLDACEMSDFALGEKGRIPQEALPRPAILRLFETFARASKKPR